jgi:hypothetical protein
MVEEIFCSPFALISLVQDQVPVDLIFTVILKEAILQLKHRSLANSL